MARDQHRMGFCAGKTAFKTAALALAVARRDKRRKGAMDVYRCPSCQGFHIGHSKPKPSNFKRRS